MSAGSAEFHARRQRVHVFIHMVFSTNAAAAQIVAGVDQDTERPGDKRRLPAKTRDASLDFQEGFLHGVFGIRLRTEKIARQILHARSLPPIEALVALQVSAEAGRRHGRVLGKFFSDPNGFRFPFERFHSPLPVACHRGEFMLPGQRKSHRSHVFLLGYRRWEEGKGLALAANSTGGVTHLFSASYSPESKGGFVRQAAARSFPLLELLHHVAQVFGREIGPPFGKKAKLCKGAFPEQKIGEALFAASSNQ